MLKAYRKTLLPSYLYFAVWIALVYDIGCQTTDYPERDAPKNQTTTYPKYYANFVLVNVYGKDVVVLTTFGGTLLQRLHKLTIPNLGYVSRTLDIPVAMQAERKIVLTAFQEINKKYIPLKINGLVSEELVLSLTPLKTPIYYYIEQRPTTSVTFTRRTHIYKFSTYFMRWFTVMPSQVIPRQISSTKYTELQTLDFNTDSHLTIVSPTKTGVSRASSTQAALKEITSTKLRTTEVSPSPSVVSTSQLMTTRAVILSTSQLSSVHLERLLPTSTALMQQRLISSTLGSGSGGGTISFHPHSSDTEISIKQIYSTRSSSQVPISVHVPATGPTEPSTPHVLPTGYCAGINESTVWGIFSWPTTKAGNKATVPCPKNGQLDAVRECLYKEQSRSTFWMAVNAENCPRLQGTSKEIFDLSNVTVNSSNVGAVVENLQSLSYPGAKLIPEDVANSATVLENIATLQSLPSEVAEKAFKTIDNILDANIGAIKKSQKVQNSSARILQSMTGLLNNMNITETGSIEKGLHNLAIGLTAINPQSFPGLGFSASVGENQKTSENDIKAQLSDERSKAGSTAIYLPETLFNDSSPNGTIPRLHTGIISFVLYKQTKLFESMTSSSGLKSSGNLSLNSYVIASEIKDYPVTNLAQPIVLTYRQINETGIRSAMCVYWSFSQSKWSEEGCTFQGVDEKGSVICHCYHLTNFAILMDTSAVGKTSSHHTQLSIISYIGCSLSLLGMVLTMLTILFFKDLRRSKPQQILLNFCVAISLTLIVFLAAAERSKTSSMVTCRIAAIALHYFSLSVFTWTAILAFNMYRLFVKVLASYVSNFSLRCCFVAWGIPAVIVAITVGVALENYGDENYCRLTGLPFTVAFFIPVVLILVVNSVAFILIFRSLITAGSKVSSDRKRNGFREIRQGIAILVLLGLTWLFGVFAIKDAKLVFQYLFCIFNSLQGLLVFVFYCLLPATMRDRYMKAFGCRSSAYSRDESGRAMLRNMETVTESYKLATISREEKGKTPVNLTNWKATSPENVRLTDSFGHQLET